MAPQKLTQKDSQVNFIPRKGSDYEDDEIRVAGMGKFTKTRYKLTVKRIVILVIVFLTVVLIVGLLSALIAKTQNPCVNGKQEQIQSTDSYDPGSTPDSATESSPITGHELWHKFRLPESLKPTHYDIQIKFDIANELYAGEVVIYFDCIEATQYVLLHVLGLNISRDSVVLSAVDNAVAVPQFKDEPFIYEPNQFFVISLKEKLQQNQAYVIRMKYLGKFSNDMSGLYLTAPKPQDGRPVRYSALSFLSPTHARRVWPCFDEPSLKANFTVSIIHRGDYTALSNMPNIGDPETLDGGWMLTRFETTPKMSTYLVAYVVCDYPHESTVLRDNVEFRVWARAEAFSDVAYALDFGPQVVRFLEEYLNIPYPLPKLDMVAVPEFTAGAMENWGLLTFREPNMLYNADQDPSTGLQRVALVVAHELGHQWFSNLVTQEFWDELWLKECFANVLAFLAMDYVYPDWHMWDEQFVGNDLLKVLKFDAQPASEPIQNKITSTGDILDSFGVIAYWKSIAVVRMMEFSLGRDIFKEGLRVFLRNRAYSNADASDLWNAISEVAVGNGLGIDINEFMNPWILQRGFPLITVSRDYQSSAIDISQELFLFDPDAIDRIAESPYGYEWITPITYTYDGGPSFTSPERFLLRETQDRLSLPSEADSNTWFLANINRTGYFRTTYDDHNWRLLQDQLNTDHQKISPSCRAALIGDAFSLASAGKANISLAMNLTKYLINEKDYVPWKVAHEYMSYIGQMLQYTSAFGNLKKYWLKQVSLLYDEIGWNDNGTELYRLLRSLILKTACDFGKEDCQRKAAEQFKSFYRDGKPVPPNFRLFVYAYGVSSNGPERDFAWQQYTNGNSSGESQLWLEALSATTEPWLLSRYLERALDPDYVSQTDTVEVFKYLGQGNPVGGYLAWNAFRSNWQTLRTRYAGGLFLMNDIIEGSTIWFNTPFLLQELETFIGTIEADLAGQAGLSSFHQAVDNTKANIRWMDMNYDEIKRWLETNVDN